MSDGICLCVGFGCGTPADSDELIAFLSPMVSASVTSELPFSGFLASGTFLPPLWTCLKFGMACGGDFGMMLRMFDVGRACGGDFGMMLRMFGVNGVESGRMLFGCCGENGGGGLGRVTIWIRGFLMFGRVLLGLMAMLLNISISAGGILVGGEGFSRRSSTAGEVDCWDMEDGVVGSSTIVDSAE